MYAVTVVLVVFMNSTPFELGRQFSFVRTEVRLEGEIDIIYQLF